MIYVSTGGLKDLSFDKAIKVLSNSGIKDFELSGGLYVENTEEKLFDLSKRYNLSLHNYFPPKKDPFVFNLASFDENIVLNSINHIKNAIKISSKIGSQFFSFHAGYLIDPQVDELGNRIKKRTVNNRQESKEIFIKRVNEVSQYAKSFGVKILIENNVLSYGNYKESLKKIHY